MENYYRTLNISQTASEEEIKTAIHNQLRVYRNTLNHRKLEKRQHAEKMVKSLDEAEKTLLDGNKRVEYDRQLEAASTQEREIDEQDLAQKENLVELGWELIRKKKYEDAVFVSTKVTAQDGNNPEAWVLSATAKYHCRNYEDSIYEYKRAISLLPNEPSIYFDLGCAYELGGRLEEALQQYERAATIDPSVTQYRAGVGSVLIEIGEYEKGLEILSKCVEEEPDNPTYQWFMAIAYADSAYLGWSYVGEGHPMLDQGYYATTYEHITTAQAYLDKATNLKFDDDTLMGKLQQVRQDIDSMLERKFTGSWPSPIIAIIIGFFLLNTPALIIGVLFAGTGILYIISSFIPKYRINSVLVNGEEFHQLPSIRERHKKMKWWERVITDIVCMPIITFYNFIKYTEIGDKLRTPVGSFFKK